MSSNTRGQIKGFSLIELMVAVSLLGLLIMLAVPGFTSFVRDSQIRTAAESVVNGLQLARAEAIRRNSNTQFKLLNTSNGVALTGGTDWSITFATAATPTVFDQAVQTRRESAPSSNARVGVANAISGTAAIAGAGLPATIFFTGMGRLNTTSTTVRQIDFTGINGGRGLTIVLAPGGDVRLCDPLLSLATNPQGCS